MIAVTNISADLNVTVDGLTVVPTATEIDSLVASSAFVNSSITTGVKNLLKTISQSYYATPPGTANVLNSKIADMFKKAGFKKPATGSVTFTPTSGALNVITTSIINDLNTLSSFKAIAQNTFSNNTWAQQANTIRGMQDSGLKKINYIGVYSSLDENAANLLNTKDENTGRFLSISSVPKMPDLKIFNYSDTTIKLRIKVEYTQFANANGTGSIYRKFITYFPNEANDQVVSYIFEINSGHNFDFDTRIRGGKATIEYTENETWSAAAVKTFTFYIRGTSPTDEQVHTYLTTSHANGTRPAFIPLNRFWFLRRMVRHESFSGNADRLRQFFAAPNGFSVATTSGLPTFGPPRGFGLGQIDNRGQLTPVQAAAVGVNLNLLKPNGSKAYQTLVSTDNRTIDSKGYVVSSDEAVWNWKANLDIMISICVDNDNSLIDKINDIAIAVNAWNAANPNDKVAPPLDITYFTITYSWVKSSIPNFDNDHTQSLFSNTQVSTITVKSFFDAMLIKRYNGIGPRPDDKRHPIPPNPRATFLREEFLYMEYDDRSKPVLKLLPFYNSYDGRIVSPNKVYYVQLVSQTNE